MSDKEDAPQVIEEGKEEVKEEAKEAVKEEVKEEEVKEEAKEKEEEVKEEKEEVKEEQKGKEQEKKTGDDIDDAFVKRFGIVTKPVDSKADPEKVILYGFRPILGMPVSVSPFCAKLEVYLKWRGIDHEIRYNLPSSPKGKYPFIQHRNRQVPDSEFCIAYLDRALGLSDDAFESASAERKAAAYSVRRMLEEATMFTVLYQRWVDDKNWPTMKAELGKTLDSFLMSAFVVPVLLRGKIKDSCELQGTGRHTPELVYEIMRRDIDSIAGLLGDRPYFFGEEMSTIDCTIYAFVANFLAPFPGEVPSFVQNHQNLVDYHARITKRLYPDFAKSE